MNALAILPEPIMALEPDWPWSALGVDTRTQADFVQWFGLNPTQARILEGLYLAAANANPEQRWLCHKRLADFSRGGTTSIKVRLVAIRDALDPGGIEDRQAMIEGKPQYGCRLTERGRDECAQALQRMKEAK